MTEAPTGNRPLPACTASGQALACRLCASVQRGFTLLEMLLVTAIGGLLLAGLSGVILQALNTYDDMGEKNALTADGQFAMQQITRAVSNSRLLLLPLRDNPATDWPEHIREQTLPASAAIGSSTLASAVLAVSLPLYVDIDKNGIPDADDDQDGRIDEDSGADRAYDLAPGIFQLDDNGFGDIDEGLLDDDDESGTVDEDPINGIDDDGDNSIDEDPPADMNADNCPGLCSVDDDGDGIIDEGVASDDDEDGDVDEDWVNPMVFLLLNGNLIQRIPVPTDIDDSNDINGQDFVAQVIAENVTRFRVERINAAAGGPDLVDITLGLSGSQGEVVTLQTRVRLGGAL